MGLGITNLSLSHYRASCADTSIIALTLLTRRQINNPPEQDKQITPHGSSHHPENYPHQHHTYTHWESLDQISMEKISFSFIYLILIS